MKIIHLLLPKHGIVMTLTVLYLTLASFMNPLFAQTEKRSLSAFNEIEIGGAFVVTLVQGNEESVEITATDDVLSKIKTKVDGEKLKIYCEKNLHSNNEILLTINFKNVKEIDASGAIKMSSKSSMTFQNLDLDLSGASKLDLDIKAEKLDVDISGSGTASVKGNVSSVDLDISGAGSFDAEQLAAVNYDIDISGVGNAVVNVTTKLDVEISGTGTVSYKGNPQIEQEISGMGKLKKM